MNRPLLPIEMFAVDISDLGKARGPLNRFFEQGYAPLVGTFVPTQTGGMIVYVLGDLTPAAPAEEAPEESAETAADDLGDGEAVDPPTGTNGNGAHHTEAPHDAASEGDAQ